MLAKVGQLLDAGTKLVWVIDAALMQAVVYSESGDVAIVRHDGDLEGGLVVPGFRCALAEVFR